MWWPRGDESFLLQGSSLYSALEVGLLATPEEIRAAFRRLALSNHPDRNADASATARFQEISEAWEVLRDPALRSEYDKLLLHRLAAEEYLRRFADLALTAQGLGLPLAGSQEPHAAAQPAAVPLIA